MGEAYDIAIIGGGINGAGIARDAAGRGHSVYLAEMGDLASGTSSWSTKLIHGGLRYLEHYEFRLVREALAEREVLLGIAPHIIRPLRFVLPHHADMRPRWLLRAGLFLYDHIGGRRALPASRALSLVTDPAGVPLKRGLFAHGFEYSDCQVDDTRLVVLNAIDARERGARIETRRRVSGAERAGGLWRLTIEDATGGGRANVTARTLVNAAGPWVGDVLARSLRLNAAAKVRLVQGSHIVVRRMFEHDRAYILQNPDGRIVFAIPYQGSFTLIGTTDRDYTGDPAAVTATEAEVAYLCDAASAYFERPVTAADVVWAFSGVRPLYDDGASEAKAATRDYVLELDAPEGEAPVLSVFGGKITTYRRLAEAALDRLGSHLGPNPGFSRGWTGTVALPGGDLPINGVDDLARELADRHGLDDAALATRLATAYGTRARRLLDGVRSKRDLGQRFGADLFEREVRYLFEEEWARSADDILWRRSKLGLVVDSGARDRLTTYLAGVGVSA